ncbi:hypothetical protein HYY70_06955 [Candidatus Woesearchaeota archaeon]|nr:hypothetical protein [Candidatus Woesearchaeota archaeon]
MRGLALFLLVVVLISSLSFLAFSINNKTENGQNDEVEKKPKIPEFSAFTSAVCESKEEFVYCRDEVFVNCNGETSKAVDVAECNGISIGIQKVNGFAVFEKEWTDTRN